MSLRVTIGHESEARGQRSAIPHSTFPIPHSEFVSLRTRVSHPSPLAPRPFSTAYRLPPTAYSAFTLVELLVVISIIGILAGLASVAGYQALIAARRAAIKTDITNLESALEKYKMDYGQYPPSNMANIDQVRRHLQKAFPKCNADEEMKYIPLRTGVLVAAYNTANVNTNNAMIPAQALVFWLQGFCADKQRPLSAAYATNPAERVAIVDFTKTRLVDPVSKAAWVAGSGMNQPVYLASTGDQPFVYFDSLSYLWHAIDSNGGAFTGSPDRIRPYLLQPWDKDGGNDIDVGATAAADVREDASGNVTPLAFQKICANPKSFQIISAGLDGDYGATNNQNSVQVGGSNTDLYFKSYPDGLGYVEGDNDNLTNFSEKALGDAKPE